MKFLITVLFGSLALSVLPAEALTPEELRRSIEERSQALQKVNEQNLRKALLYATTLASFNVEGFGMARTAPLTLADVERRLKTLVRFSSVN